ncbi:MAG: glucose-1-phosphate adenylyltransferase subunit GlgD [Oscillospiraceae bacterium]|jgi:glucose-1-phosphate adenylyltransferase|nr:glucose-1-phosphate adenylyltransferase subunit GlgD [Oscillospiraceae bacterium]
MSDMHGLIYAYHASPSLGGFTESRTSASLPFCARYRLIDFALSAMTNAGIRNVGVVMQHDYQSLLDHLGSGKDWELSRLSGGLRLLPPFGIRGSHIGEYRGCMDALSAVQTYIDRILEDFVVLFRGDLAVNLDLHAVLDAHLRTGCEITAVCTENPRRGTSGACFVPDEAGVSREMLFSDSVPKGAVQSIEVYVITKALLVRLIDWSRANGRGHFHRDALAHYLRTGGAVGVYRHRGYTPSICTAADYFNANMAMLRRESRGDLFSDARPVYTKGRSSVSTYYGENASSQNSLVADGCYIEGELVNCILFRGVRVEKGAKLHNCVVMQDSVIGENAALSYVISDKYTVFSKGLVLSGNSRLPITVPKCKII